MSIATLRSNSVIKLGTKSKRIILDKNNIHTLFARLDNRRDIRRGIVIQLCKLLESGEHFDTPLCTNLKRDKHRLLDGNHRIDAVEKYLKKYPDRRVEIEIDYYTGLSDGQERKIYTKWNKGTKQNVNDFVKQYWNVIPLAKMFDKATGLRYGVSHKWGVNTVEFKTLVSCYLTKEDEPFKGGYGGGAEDFIKQTRHLGQKAFNDLKAFMNEYSTAFGKPDKTNMHYKQANLFALQRIWLDNKANKTPAEIATAYRRVFGCRPVVEFARLGGTRENCKESHRQLLDVINGQKKRNLFV